MRKRTMLILAPAAASVVTLLGAAPAVAATPATAVPHAFACSGVISRPYTLQSVTGTLTGTRPTNVAEFDYTGARQVSVATPARTNGWWGGYWLTTYGLNQWNLGADTSARYYHLMLPASRPGSAFTALLVTEFGRGGVNGNWQNWMSCTAG